VPVYDLRAQEEQVSLAMQRERSLATLLAGFGVLALALALVGLYGVLSYSVTRRTAEIGIRMAVGAAPGQLRWMILGESLVPVLCGVGAGLALTWWFSELLAKLVFKVEPLDPWSIGAAVAILLAGAAVAAWLPAYRASRVSPVTALRYE
jgi:ABC-type antimicrobial peptide transport system permease subunit